MSFPYADLRLNLEVDFDLASVRQQARTLPREPTRAPPSPFPSFVRPLDFFNRIQAFP